MVCPPFLSLDPGLNSGYMIAHYLAAGLAAENKILAHPSAVDSIPTSANIEDFNSMGTTGARHLDGHRPQRREDRCCRGAVCRSGVRSDGASRPTDVLGEVYRLIREHVPMLESDNRIVADDVEAITAGL